MHNSESRLKGDEPILNRGDFVETALKAARGIWIENPGSVI